MKTPLALLNLMHNKVKTTVAVGGVTFAVVLMFMQLGFLQAVRASAEIIYQDLNFDICLRSRDYLLLSDAKSFPETRLYQAENASGVTNVSPCDVELYLWRIPRQIRERTMIETMLRWKAFPMPGATRPLAAKQGEQRSILVMGVRRGDQVFKSQVLHDAIQRNLTGADTLLLDTATHAAYGAANEQAFNRNDVGLRAEINGQPVLVGGTFRRGAGLSASGAVVVTDHGFDRLSLPSRRDQVTFGLIEVADGVDPQIVATDLNRRLPNDVEAVTREAAIRDEQYEWTWNTNYGLIFVTGVVIALIVGTAIVYQVLASDIASLLPEYATLKAIGYGNKYLATIVLQQAILLAAASLVPGFLIALGLYSVTSAIAAIPIEMTTANAVLVVVLTILMCCVSGLVAMQKAFRAAPADLF